MQTRKLQHITISKVYTTNLPIFPSRLNKNGFGSVFLGSELELLVVFEEFDTLLAFVEDSRVPIETSLILLVFWVLLVLL